MTHDDVIKQLRGEIADKLAARNKRAEEARGLEVGSDERVTARAEVDTFDAEIDVLNERLASVESEKVRDEAANRLAGEIRATAAPKYDEVARTGAEPRTYTRHADVSEGVSFFRDAFKAERGDVQARDRIERHSREVLVEREAMTERATTTSSYAGLVVPQYLVDLAANVLRNGRPLANAVTRLPIPDQGMSFLLPRATTGVTEASQATENSAVSSTDQVWANTTVPVATIAGQQDVSRQSIERGTPGLDALIYADLAAAYAAELDRQIFVGTGASGQMTGINGQSGINTATLFGAAVTTATFYSKLAGQIAAVAGAGTAVRPSLIVMHPRRWGWLTLQVDSSNRPLVTPTANGPYNAFGINSQPGGYGQEGLDYTSGFDIVGTLHGLPVITDANVPTNLGGGSTEDVVFVLDQRHALLFEDGDGAPRQFRFEQTLGNQLTVKMVAYNYAAFTAGRYPAAFGRVGGADATGANGLQAPTY